MTFLFEIRKDDSVYKTIEIAFYDTMAEMYIIQINIV